MRSPLSVIGLAALAVSLSACVHHGARVNPSQTAVFVRQITLYEHPLDVHFARPRGSRAVARPLLLYATGDGGWRGKDRELFEQLASFGYPVAGFSARNYLKNLGYVADTTTPARLARDYELLIQFAKKELELPADSPVILVGVSRGAGLEVVAAGQPAVRTRIGGVLAIALTKEEEYVRHYLIRRGNLPPGTPRRELVMIQTYQYLPRLSSMPVEVIQSTNDNYLPAAQARELFGPDTPDRRFRTIDSRNHSFSDARDVLYGEVASALDWISSSITAAAHAADIR